MQQSVDSRTGWGLGGWWGKPAAAPSHGGQAGRVCRSCVVSPAKGQPASHQREMMQGRWGQQTAPQFRSQTALPRLLALPLIPGEIS